ncbi:MULTISPECIES: efflux RND transporter periplasmic adaptor subunit [Caballeronia]|uniref:efflux RND transporter periplasmic adaptor subunit n=1 Tax=Caballeronia TaxID=1827195 RepID=UPI00158EBEF7|nr:MULTISPECIES: efflux RND transporter periplasmic adaptor subunit [Caballeronia]MCG7399202.1 efflux RND transporter periplasmic adaptor subunit [Caballeronia zhejiangensis]MCI1042291.1 efflux RND transporter periplasmic adaptor subunit [Caballeronia zhejiangensis]
MRLIRIPYRLIGVTTAALLAAGCGEKHPAMAPHTPEVGVVIVEPAAVPVTTELSGRTSAFLDAQVRARVDGIVLRREFTEGSLVKAGQRLYKIDPAPYIAQLNNAKASFAKAHANLVSTAAQAERYKVLVASNAVSKQDYDNAVAAQGQAEADVASAKAAIDTAQIKLGYTDVTSPVSGQAGISQVTPGAYVQAAQATLMVTVQQLDPMYVDLTQSSLDGLKLRRQIQEGRLSTNGPNAAKVTLILEDGREYPEQGKLQFSDVSVDPSTGSVTLRAIFMNKDRVLLPGMFVRARIEQGVNPKALVVPVQGITHDQKGTALAMVVGKDNKVAMRPLVTSGTLGQSWIVDSGLNAGDRVIVEGIDHVRPGMEVKAVPARQPEAKADAKAEAKAEAKADATAASGA